MGSGISFAPLYNPVSLWLACFLLMGPSELDLEMISDYMNVRKNGKKKPNRPVSRLGALREWRSHPLMHTLLEFTLAQYIEGCQG